MNYILLAIFIAIYLIGVVATIYQVYKITVIDSKARGIKHPKLMGLLATSGKSSEGIILYLLHRRKYPIKNITKEKKIKYFFNSIFYVHNILIVRLITFFFYGICISPDRNIECYFIAIR